MSEGLETDGITFIAFIARVTVVHFVTYFIYGLIFSIGLDYQHVFAYPDVACYARSLDDPIVAYGPIIQLLRGALFGLALYPLRQIFFERRKGWVWMWGLLVLLQIFLAPSGFIENLVYTKIPIWFWVMLIPEVVVQLLTFSLLIHTWERNQDKRLSAGLAIAFVIFLGLGILAILMT